MITDGFGWLLEYQFYKKTLIFIERPDHVPFMKHSEDILLGVHRVSIINVSYNHLFNSLTNKLFDRWF